MVISFTVSSTIRKNMTTSDYGKLSEKILRDGRRRHLLLETQELSENSEIGYEPMGYG